jgi:hypothetical protein
MSSASATTGEFSLVKKNIRDGAVSPEFVPADQADRSERRRRGPAPSHRSRSGVISREQSISLQSRAPPDLHRQYARPGGWHPRARWFVVRIAGGIQKLHYGNGLLLTGINVYTCGPDAKAGVGHGDHVLTWHDGFETRKALVVCLCGAL